jgi:hypothetical protein
MTQERADALIVNDEAEHANYSRFIIELAQKSRLPAIFPYLFSLNKAGDGRRG